MSVIVVNTTDTFDQWRVKCNEISTGMGDLVNLPPGQTNMVDAVNYAVSSSQGNAIVMAIALG